MEVCSIFINFICAGVADKMFPFLRNRTDKGLSPIEKKDLFKDCGSITLFSLSSVVVKAFEIHDAAVYRTPPAGDLNSFVECFGISDC